jgi:hypothetical protein
MLCPIKTDPSWIALEKAQPKLAHYLWNKYEGNVPSSYYKTSTEVKPGVEELFNENSELANQVYEALGFSNEIKNPIYSAVFFDTNEVISKYKPIHTNVFSHHSTIQFKPEDISKLPVGEKRNIKIVGRLITDKVDVLIVENSLSKNKFPHITLSTAEGIKPFESNKEIEQNQDKIIKVNDTLNGTIGVFDGKNEVTSKITSQQKQQALQQYSSYLDTIFPDSKVKDIVYKGGSENIDYIKDFDKIEKETSGSYYPDFSRKGLFFTNKKELAKKYGKVKSFIINLSKASEYTTGDETSKIDVIEFGKYGDKSRIIYWKNPKDKSLQKFTDLAEYIIFEPSQIHILGNKKDIEGFKKFVNKDSSEEEVYIESCNI